MIACPIVHTVGKHTDRFDKHWHVESCFQSRLRFSLGSSLAGRILPSIQCHLSSRSLQETAKVIVVVWTLVTRMDTPTFFSMLGLSVNERQQLVATCSPGMGFFSGVMQI